MPDRDPLLIALGQALRRMRRERRLSQEEVSLRTGVHRNYVGGVERGEREPTVTTIARLAAALDTSMASIFAEAEALMDQQGDARSG